jgi:hypothetical protein
MHPLMSAVLLACGRDPRARVGLPPR